MPVHFVLKRFLPDFRKYGDLYEAIKSGRKTVEYRDDTEYWAKRLLSLEGLDRYYSILHEGKDAQYMFRGGELKHKECTFRVGYTSGPTLHAFIKEVLWRILTHQFEVRIENVREVEA